LKWYLLLPVTWFNLLNVILGSFLLATVRKTPLVYKDLWKQCPLKGFFDILVKTP
jgi:hypothetical protein